MAMLVTMGGALFLLAAETAGELTLGFTAQQSRMTGLFGLYTLVAARVEELIFRGYLVVENRGRGAWLTGIIGASLGFAHLHPFLWEWRNASLHFQGGAQAWFSTAAVYAGSRWFYAARSLLPCVAAPAAKNLGVLALKYAQGFVDGWW